MKKIPPWALVAGAVAVGALIWLIKQRREKLAQEAAEAQPAAEGPYIAGVEQPEEYPYAVAGGVGGGSSGAIGSAGESQSVLSEIFRNEQTFLSESEKSQTEFERSLGQQLKENQEALSHMTSSTIASGSGGGAPESTKSGVTAAPSTPPKCPSSYPNWNSKNGGVSPHSCFKNTKCGNGCAGHQYQDGHTECQHKSGGKCTW